MKYLKIVYIILILSIFLAVHNVEAKPTKISIGKKVTMDYITKINGQVVETTIGKQPVTFIMGDGKLIPNLAKKIEGLKEGDKKVIKLTPKEGYGEIIKEAIHEFPKSSFPKGTNLTKGNFIEAAGPEGKKVLGLITETSADKVIVDFNHPYAGKNLEIEVKIVSVQ